MWFALGAAEPSCWLKRAAQWRGCLSCARQQTEQVLLDAQVQNRARPPVLWCAWRLGLDVSTLMIVEPDS